MLALNEADKRIFNCSTASAAQRDEKLSSASVEHFKNL
jgi:hypothetical protein